MGEFNLESYLSNGVENIVKGVMKASAKNPMASVYMMQAVKENKRARQMRQKAESGGRHIPPFLIASITSQCNLHCKGCYARANHSCCDEEDGKEKLLDAGQWEAIFEQAAGLGISFILLAGGEPFVRKDVLYAAGRQKKILFPVFTNGTLMDNDSLEMLSRNRNLLPVLSIEGNERTTDARRGDGVFCTLKQTMEDLKSRGILFGASVTIHKENAKEVLSEEFLEDLRMSGCKAVIYVEYVPVDHASMELAFDDSDRKAMQERLAVLKEEDEKMLYIAFPGDEKSSGGCLAAGRGFFHINASGGAEPCPFSPYSDTCLTEASLEEALGSPLFKRLKEEGALMGEHIGGCVLFEQEEKVKELLGGNI